ncbi:MAG: 1-hydroxycarotenoid 3,4-desaturase CrtD [Pseudomonadota bacterium]
MLKRTASNRTIVIGAGIGGLAAALRLAHAGQDVIVLDRAGGPGGKLRTMPSVAGPVDAGPTVFTMKPLFDRLYCEVGERLEDHIEAIAEPVLARHWWPDSGPLDLYADPERSAEAIRAFSGAKSEAEFRRFSAKAKQLFKAFEAPIMHAPQPKLGAVTKRVLTAPGLMGALAPHKSMWRWLRGQFSDPRLVQLFGRYATYVGGSPFDSPALLALIWHAEASGVWRIKGGMHRLATALEGLAESRGARFQYGAHVTKIATNGPQSFRVLLATGEELLTDNVVFNGDPAALAAGMLGEDVTRTVRTEGVAPRALSAFVWSFAAEPQGLDLTHHNVFFNHHYRREFAAIDAGRMPVDATLYVCAQDRGAGLTPSGPERFEIIMNGAAAPADYVQLAAKPAEERHSCRLLIFQTLERAGLVFSPRPDISALTTPADFANLFPGSDGSLYGRSPHGMMASFKRPVVRTTLPGLYLAGGGVHPGPGLPMAMSSGRHAAAAILTDHASTSRSPRTDTRGGMSTDSRMTDAMASRSLPS